MSGKSRKKAKRKATGVPFGPDNPPPKSPGRPPKGPPPPEPVYDPSIPLQLWAVRVAAGWVHNTLPLNPAVRMYVQLRKKSGGQFSSQWAALERQFSGKSESVTDDQPQVPAEAVENEKIECPTSEKVIEELGDWLERHRVEAEERAAKLSRGEKA
jgi:hypothetical protein